MVLSSGARVTRTFNTASVLIEPAKTRSPGSFTRGTDSPVTGLSSTPDVPSITSPSAGTRSPGRTRTALPMTRLSAGTSRTRGPQPRGLRHQRAERTDAGPRPARCDPLEHFADGEQEDDRRRLGGSTDRQRAGGGDRHQHLDRERLPQTRRCKGAPGDGNKPASL